MLRISKCGFQRIINSLKIDDVHLVSCILLHFFKKSEQKLAKKDSAHMYGVLTSQLTQLFSIKGKKLCFKEIGMSCLQMFQQLKLDKPSHKRRNI